MKINRRIECEGYEIIKSEYYSQIKGIAWGKKNTYVNNRPITKYVTWEFIETFRGYEFYFGHYFDTPLNPTEEEEERTEALVKRDYHCRLANAYELKNS